MSHLIITHTDSDGYVSAAIVYKYLKLNNVNDILNISWTYGSSYNQIEEMINDDISDIWMTDITLPNPFMEKYASLIHHYDHHSSVLSSDLFSHYNDILKEEQSAITIDGFIGMNGTQAKQIAACELVWLKLFPNTSLPKFVHFIGRYDVWDHDKDDHSLAMNEYCFMFQPNNPSILKTKWIDPDFQKLFDDTECEKALIEGKTLLNYKKLFAAHNSPKISSVIKFKNIPILVSNIGLVNSTYFDKVLDNYNFKHSIAIKAILIFNFNLLKMSWKCSCYGVHGFDSLSLLEDIYENSIQEEDKLSFGGHKSACGCVFKMNSITGFLNYLKMNMTSINNF